MAVQRKQVQTTIKKNQAAIKSASKQSARLRKSATRSERVANRLTRVRRNGGSRPDTLS